MKLLSGLAPKNFNLLSIGHRGVGKTVFLAGSYADLQSSRSAARSRSIWFDCRDKQAQENLEKLLSYVSRTGQYPPPTMKTTNFSFSVKRKGLMGEQTLCHFRWWDIPGEICNFQNPDFQRLLLTSHGCCFFINAKSLVEDKSYTPVLEQTFKQVETIGSLVRQSNLKYIFALVLTQCDLLDPGPLGVLQIEEKLHPLTERLDAAGVPYQKFYSGIPIFTGANGAVLGGGNSHVSAPLVWILSELRRFHSFQPQLDLASGLKQFQASMGTLPSRRTPPLNVASADRRNLLLYGFAGLSVLGMLLALLSSTGVLRPSIANQGEVANTQRIQEYEQVLKRDPSNATALTSLASVYIEQEQYDQAIPLVRKLVDQDPNNMDLRFNLAQLYQFSGQRDQEAAIYDQVLGKQPDNLMALTRKAVLLTEKGEIDSAKSIFARAEKVAPADLKPRVQALAKDALDAASKSNKP
jgi:hypothetical protein